MFSAPLIHVVDDLTTATEHMHEHEDNECAGIGPAFCQRLAGLLVSRSAIGDRRSAIGDTLH